MPVTDVRSGQDGEDALPGEGYPLRREAEQALRAAQTPPPGWHPLGYTAADYVGLLRGICGYFKGYQDERGAIVDPYAGEEKQYATPCYAVAAALVALDGRPPAGVWGAARRRGGEAPGDAGLLESAARAQDHALRSLAVEKNTPQNHADFFAPLVVIGCQLLAPFVAAERSARWLAELRSIEPEHIYRNTFSWKREHDQEPTVHNWNVVAVAGEMLRHLLGASPDLVWVDRYVTYQLREHADREWGLYRDPSTPLPYDLFPRHHLGYALAAAGAAGRPVSAHQAQLEDWLRRGEWTSALTQTGSGGIPPGWRSSEHLWNDAALVALGEIAAARHARAGRRAAAGLFRRVAALAFRDVLHWRRPGGDLHVVKNHFDPSERFGFEGYSFHSNYGLYPAAMIATAVLFGNCAAPEAPTPVETAALVVRYPDPFHRLVAACGGTTLAFDLDGDGKYDVTGLNSVRHAGAHPLLGPASGIPAQPRYHVPQAPGSAYGAGLAWSAAGGAPVSLAGLCPKRVDLRVERTDPAEVAFTLRYLVQDAGCEAITSRYRLTPDEVAVDEAFEGAASARESLRLTFPFPADDGRDRATVTPAGDGLEVRLGGAAQLVALHGGALLVDGQRVAHRNGFAGIARGRALTPAATLRWSLRYA